MIKTVLDRKNPNGPYVFISYSHENESAVNRALSALDNLGANFWYDVKLKTGDKWDEKVEEVILNKNCCGILYFISSDFLISDACMKEFDLRKTICAERLGFRTAFVLLDKVKATDFNSFAAKITKDLVDRFQNNMTKMMEACNRVNYFVNEFDMNSIHQIVSEDGIDGDEFISKIFKDVFSAWGCASEETGKIDALQNDNMIGGNYYLNAHSRILENEVNGRDVDWKVFAYNGNTISAILVSDELYGITCLSLAKNEMQAINENIKSLFESQVDKIAIKRKHIKFNNKFAECIKVDDNGNYVRFLKATEHENNYLQLKEALTKVTDTSADDGYYFVQDNQGNIVFADRGSEDVFRHIHVDAYASIIPVIDVDYNLYKEYIFMRNNH